MPLIIKEMNFSTGDIPEITEAIQCLRQLENPKFIGMDQSLYINETNSITILEGEIAHIKNREKRYLATKNSLQCLFVHIQSPTDDLIIHVPGNDYHLNFDILLKDFTDKNQIKVTLLGGSAEDPTSINTLAYILKNMINCKLTMTLIKQQVIWKNHKTAEAVPAMFKDTILAKAAILYKYMYKKNLDLKLHGQHKSSDFLNRHSAAADHIRIEALSNAMKCINTLMEITCIKYVNEKIAELTYYVPDENEFNRVLREFFSIQGLAQTKINSAVLLTNMAIDVQTGAVHRISKLIETPLENERYIKSLDPDQTYQYFHCYKNNQFIMPVMGTKMSNALVELREPLKQGVLTESLKEKLVALHPYFNEDRFVMCKFAAAVNGIHEQAMVMQPLLNFRNMNIAENTQNTSEAGPSNNSNKI